MGIDAADLHRTDTLGPGVIHAGAAHVFALEEGGTGSAEELPRF